jgi:hypothetical protein
MAASIRNPFGEGRATACDMHGRPLDNAGDRHDVEAQARAALAYDPGYQTGATRPSVTIKRLVCASFFAGLCIGLMLAGCADILRALPA